jgi:hypothetical protein
VGLKRAGLLLALSLCALGLLVAALTAIAVPLGLGGAGFGYKKVLALFLGLEIAFCGALLWRRLRALPE